MYETYIAIQTNSLLPDKKYGRWNFKKLSRDVRIIDLLRVTTMSLHLLYAAQKYVSTYEVKDLA